MTTAFELIDLAGTRLRNRIVMAPMTRSRAYGPVTDAVHAEGGVIFTQLMHTGRIGHPSLLPEDLTPVGPSPVAAAGQVFTLAGIKDFVTPVELDEGGIAQTINDLAHADRNAITAGFDGVELHGANGYLLRQFLSTNANQRDHRWGGSIPAFMHNRGQILSHHD